MLIVLVGPSLAISYHNLVGDFAPFVPARDQLLLVMYALGGTDIPDILFKSVRLPQRRWNADGEVEKTGAAQFGLPTNLVDLLCDEVQLSETTTEPWIIIRAREDNTTAWSLCPELMSNFAETLLAPTIEELETTAMRILCFTSPLCYEGNTEW